MKGRFSTALTALLLLVGIAGMIYFNYRYFSERGGELAVEEGGEEVLLDETPEFGATQEIDIEPTQVEPQVLYENDFTGTLDFEEVDTGTKDTPSDWAIENGQLVQNANIWGGDFGRPPGGNSFLGTMTLVPNQNWTDFEMTFRMKGDDNDGMGAVFRYNDAGYHRILSVKEPVNGGPFLMLDRRIVENGRAVYEEIDTDLDFDYEIGKWYDVRILAKDNCFKVYIDGEEKLNGTDAEFSSGTVGFYSYGQAGLAYDDLVVKEIFKDVCGEPDNIIASTSPSDSEDEEGVNEEEPSSSFEDSYSGIIQSIDSGVITITMADTGRIKRVQIIDSTIIQSGSEMGVTISLEDLEEGGEIEIVGGEYQSKLDDEELIIAEKIISKTL